MQRTSGFHSCIVPGKVVEIPPLVSWMGYLSMLGHCPADNGIFPVSAGEAKAVVPGDKAYRATLNQVFSLAGIDLAANQIISHMFCSFERSCPPQEIKPPDCNLSLVLRSLTHPPYDPLKLSSNKHLTWKMCFLLALLLTRRVSELHGLSYKVRHSHGFGSCTFSFLSELVTKTRNPSVPNDRFEEFTVLSLDDFVGDDREKFLLCPIRALR